MTSPLHLLIAIHYHVSGSGEDYCAGTPHGESTATANCIQELVNSGLLKRGNSSEDVFKRRYEPTGGLPVYIESLCNVRFPVQMW